MSLLEELKTRVLCGDGAMGTLLLEQGFSQEQCLEELCLTAPGRVRALHEEYIRAGARVIETNSFGGNAVRLERFGLGQRTREINRAAADLAGAAAKGKNVFVAGSVGPSGVSADEAILRGVDRAAAYREQIIGLSEGGADILFYETFMDFDELLLAFETGKSVAPEAATICSFACDPEGRLQNGLPIVEAFEKLRGLGADVVGVNCLNGPHAMVQLLQRIPAGPPLSAYANAGYPRYAGGRYIYPSAPDYFAKSALEMAAEGAGLIGGCCGTTPAHVAAMAKALQGLEPVREKARRVAPPPAPRRITQPDREESLLERMAAGQRVIICELDPPKTLSLDKFFTGAQALSQAGCDAITLADNSLAILRVSNLAVGAMLKERFGITPLLHLSCRDRNILGLQSELLGMAALGMRHVLPLTGDPARVGDHPGAKSVYDVNSVELIGIIKRLNEGYSYAGKSIKHATDFVIGCTYNPNAKNIEAQVERLERKVAAGAQYAMTQPVFDPALIAETKRRTAHLNIPIFLGIWPLLSGRQAEFLHHEVPGIVVPETVRAQMQGLEKEEGRAQGLAIAKAITEAALREFNGIYLITPFLNFETTTELAQFARSL